MEAYSNLQSMTAAALKCTACGLCKTRSRVVPGEGSDHAEIMFIGEGPGYHEDQQGRPFVGPAGQLLNQLLGSIGLKREEVYIANVVKCRPPGNRDPLPEEIEACRPWLDAQIALINPRVIVTLGRHSMARFLPGDTITKVHGGTRKIGDRVLVPMYHPAAALYRQELKKVLEEDFKKIPAAVQLAKHPDKPPQPVPKPQIPVQPQLQPQTRPSPQSQKPIAAAKDSPNEPQQLSLF